MQLKVVIKGRYQGKVGKVDKVGKVEGMGSEVSDSGRGVG